MLENLLVQEGAWDKSAFFGREKELVWLDGKLFAKQYTSTPIFVSGLPGIGKTSLIKHWVYSRNLTKDVFWINLEKSANPRSEVDTFTFAIKEQRFKGPIIVVIDGIDGLGKNYNEEISERIFNYKSVSTLILIGRVNIHLKNSELLNLGFLSKSELDLFVSEKISDIKFRSNLEKILTSTNGHPIALSVISQMLKRPDIFSLQNSLGNLIYSPEKSIITPNNEIVKSVPPIIVSTNNNLVIALQKQPKDIYKLSSREFEVLLADLLTDMGMEVELTKQTRDGGSDILAYMNTEIGRILCLVEAKHRREDKKIGVELVRTLYGTLCDRQANSAMLVTTSSFSKDAKEFQKKHSYQINLKEYGDIINWIIKYGNKKG